MRIAFLTPELAAESDRGGGLGVYIQQVATALVAGGHGVEIFATTSGRSRQLLTDGVVVHFIRPVGRTLLSLLRRFALLSSRGSLMGFCTAMSGAFSLARSFRFENEREPFDVVQCSDYGFPSLFLHGRRGALLVIRCSWPVKFALRLDGRAGILDRYYAHLEESCLQRSELIYAPSDFVAKYYRRRGLRVEVVRPPLPPLATNAEPARDQSDRYLMFAGLITPRKGTRVLAAALTLIWKEDTAFRMVWAGTEIVPGEIANYRKLWGAFADRIDYRGALPRHDLHAAMRGAIAIVLPSVADNLPNTAIESLALGVPVITTRRNGVDELVDSYCGEAVDDYPPELAAAMLRAWRGESSWFRTGFRRPALFVAMEPGAAASNLVQLFNSKR